MSTTTPAGSATLKAYEDKVIAQVQEGQNQARAA
jgi:hypothetical protein